MKLGGAAAGVGTGGGRAASGRQPAADSDDGVVEAWGAASSIPPLNEPSGPAMLPLDIERDMWQSFAAVRQRRAIRLAKITLGLVCALRPTEKTNQYSDRASEPLLKSS